jgi:hypothetical protein
MIVEKRRRETMKRIIIAVTLGALALLTAVMPVAASKGWCRTDPIVSIDGRTADIFISGPETAPLQVTGPNLVYVIVPVGVPASLVATDMGFGHGTETNFLESSSLKVTEEGVEVLIGLYVPANDDTMPVRLEFAPLLVEMLRPVSVEGTANTWLTLKVVF